MYERKTIIKNLLKKYNKTYISVVENLDREKAGCVSSCNFKVYFDVMGDSILIEDIITKENISVYYEFMGDDNIIKNLNLLNDVLFERYFYILTHFKEIGFISEDKNTYKSLREWEQIGFKNKHIKRDGYKYYEISFFDIKDTLKPINEYIAKIKKSEQYIALMSKK